MINTPLINLTCNDKLLEARDSIQELSFGGTSLYEFGKRRTIEAAWVKTEKYHSSERCFGQVLIEPRKDLPMTPSVHRKP
jgi:hypothetical protein